MCSILNAALFRYRFVGKWESIEDDWENSVKNILNFLAIITHLLLRGKEILSNEVNGRCFFLSIQSCIKEYERLYFVHVINFWYKYIYIRVQV